MNEDKKRAEMLSILAHGAALGMETAKPKVKVHGRTTSGLSTSGLSKKQRKCRKRKNRMQRISRRKNR